MIIDKNLDSVKEIVFELEDILTGILNNRKISCASCGTENKYLNRYCQVCGLELNYIKTTKNYSPLGKQVYNKFDLNKN